VATSSETSIWPANIWGYATPYRPVIDWKMNDLEWLYDVKLGFHTSSFRFRGFDFQTYLREN